MRISTVWAVRKHSPDEPELVVAWDEFCIDANPEGFDEDVKRALESMGSDLLTHRVIVLRANYPDIVEAFQPPEIEVTQEET